MNQNHVSFIEIFFNHVDCTPENFYHHFYTLDNLGQKRYDIDCYEFEEIMMKEFSSAAKDQYSKQSITDTIHNKQKLRGVSNVIDNMYNKWISRGVISHIDPKSGINSYIVVRPHLLYQTELDIVPTSFFDLEKEIAPDSVWSEYGALTKKEIKTFVEKFGSVYFPVIMNHLELETDKVYSLPENYLFDLLKVIDKKYKENFEELYHVRRDHQGCKFGKIRATL